MMKIALLRNLSISTRKLIFPKSIPNVSPPPPFPPFTPPSSKLRFFSTSDTEPSSPNPDTTTVAAEITETETKKKVVSLDDIEDVSNRDLKLEIEKYFKKGDEEALPSIFEMILKRRLKGKHVDTDDELKEELRRMPLVNVPDKEFESDFEETYKTDDDLDDLHNTPEYIKNKMVKDENFNINDKKWDGVIKEATEKGLLKDTRECEEMLEDLMSWDKLLPDEIKKKVKERLNELQDMCDRGELKNEEASELFKEFEDKMVVEYQETMAAEGPPQFDESTALKADRNVRLDDPPGEGPILRWVSRAVFAPGGDAWHPKNRKVKMSVTVKELELSKHQFRRLRELVGKRYHPGRDELTITSERFEHREENRKDCYRTLLMLLEESGKANKLVEDARTSYVKDRLRANPMFMERLRAKTTRLQESKLVTV